MLTEKNCTGSKNRNFKDRVGDRKTTKLLNASHEKEWETDRLHSGSSSLSHHWT